MLASGFDYDLPDSLIAQSPLDDRHDSRLLVLGKSGIVHAKFTSLSNYLEAGDALILNDTKVIPARLRGRKSTGGAVELLLVDGAACRWRCMARGPGLKTGTRVMFGEDVSATLGEINDDFREVIFNTAIDRNGLMGRIGEAPTPPYIKERLVDGDRYQTVYASEPGSIAAPTAGLHFTREILDELDKAGVIVQRLTLKIGPGTFLPLRTEMVGEHRMHEEHVHLTPQTADVLNRVRLDGGKWCAVGTSTVRALESACSPDGRLSPMDAPTGLFIYPGYEFNSRPELLLTNFHLPRSTNLLLACAYGGTDRVLDAYREAVDLRYRFYSFGDAMLAEGDRP